MYEYTNIHATHPLLHYLCISLRLSSRGYDVNSPSKVIVIHDRQYAMSPDKELFNPLERLKNGTVCMYVCMYMHGGSVCMNDTWVIYSDVCTVSKYVCMYVCI